MLWTQTRRRLVFWHIWDFTNMYKEATVVISSMVDGGDGGKKKLLVSMETSSFSSPKHLEQKNTNDTGSPTRTSIERRKFTSLLLWTQLNLELQVQVWEGSVFTAQCEFVLKNWPVVSFWMFVVLRRRWPSRLWRLPCPAQEAHTGTGTATDTGTGLVTGTGLATGTGLDWSDCKIHGLSAGWSRTERPPPGTHPCRWGWSCVSVCTCS